MPLLKMRRDANVLKAGAKLVADLRVEGFR